MLHSCMSFLDSVSESIAFSFVCVTRLLLLPTLMCVFQAAVNNYIDDVAAVVLTEF